MSATTVVVGENTGVLGRAVKSNADVERVVVDLSSWLDPGESVAAVSGATLAVAQTTVETAWQTDYPLAPFNAAVADTDPLVLVGLNISGTSINVLLDDGTPGLTYIVSFLVAGNTSGRTKEIDLVVAVIAAVNTAMVTSQTGPSTTITTTSSLALSLGYSGTVYVNNTTSAPVTITLPPTPTLGQTISGADIAGNANANKIRWIGAAGALISNQSEYDFTTAYQSATFQWNGSGWSVIAAASAAPVVVNVTSSSYTLGAYNVGVIFVNFAGAVSIVLNPTFMAANQEVVIMDRGGNASLAQPITITTTGGATLNGASSAVINTAYGRTTLIFDGTNFGVI